MLTVQVASGYLAAGVASYLASLLHLSYGEYMAVTLTVVLQSLGEVNHAPAAVVAFAKTTLRL